MYTSYTIQCFISCHLWPYMSIQNAICRVAKNLIFLWSADKMKTEEFRCYQMTNTALELGLPKSDASIGESRK